MFKDNIKNWSFKSKNTSSNYNIRSSDVNKIMDSNYSVHFTDSTGKKTNFKICNFWFKLNLA